MRRSKKTSKLRVTGLCAGNSPETGEFPAQRASNAENGSIWWRHHVFDTVGQWNGTMDHGGIGAGNGLSHTRPQTITWTVAG